MKAYLLTAVGVIFLTVIISFIVPEGKLKKSVNFVLRLVSIGMLVSPVTKIFTFAPSESTASYDYEYVAQVYAQNQSRLLTQKVADELGYDCVCNVEIEYKEHKICENGVNVYGNFENVQTVEEITEYLQGLGYIHITVNETTD
ncbi:MAG: stage III sporulation protein AF [Clostridia bacterium]|nr:stage III sporulation protein AF [Clostridia bacterium]